MSLNSHNFWTFVWVSLLVGIPLAGMGIYGLAELFERIRWPGEKR